METREAGSHLCASSAKSKVTGLLHALRRPISKHLFRPKYQASLDSVAYHVMMGESATHYSMSTSDSNEQSPSAGHQADAGGFYLQSLTQLDGSSPSRSSLSASPSTPCTPPTPSTPSGTRHPQLQTCEPTRAINVYEYGKPASYPGPDVALIPLATIWFER